MSVPMPDVSGTEDIANETVSEPVNSGGDSGSETAGGINPSWNEILEALPSSLHGQVTPVLKKWDDNFRQVQSQYEPLKPYLEVPPQELEAAYELFRLANTNPELLYKEMGSYYGFGGAGGQGQEQQNPQNPSESNDEGLDLGEAELGDLANHPQIKKLLENQEAVAQILVGQHQAQEEARLNEQLDSEMNTILEQYPQFGQGPDNGAEHQVMIYNLAVAGNMTLTEAAQKLAGYSQSIAQSAAAPNAPSVLGGNGALPATNTLDPTKIDDKTTRNLVAEILANNKG